MKNIKIYSKMKGDEGSSASQSNKVDIVSTTLDKTGSSVDEVSSFNSEPSLTDSESNLISNNNNNNNGMGRLGARAVHQARVVKLKMRAVKEEMKTINLYM